MIRPPIKIIIANKASDDCRPFDTVNFKRHALSPISSMTASRRFRALAAVDYRTRENLELTTLIAKIRWIENDR